MTRKYFAVGFALLAISLVATAIVYPHLPSQIPTHWNTRGEVDGYGARWTLFLYLPGLMLGLLGLFAILPWLSPRRFEVDTFRSTYLYIMVVMLAFVVYVHGVMMWGALKGRLEMPKAILGGVCLLFALLGNVLGKVQRNFYIGIRTPWTIAEERVWNATHRLAAKTFVLGGLVAFVLALAGLPWWVPFAALMAGAFIPAIYSLVYYKQLERRGEIS
jgi:uncharacterized membrane protein